jgi:3-polyprenyl-4-hydroxybenzoate decarboxylase
MALMKTDVYAGKDLGTLDVSVTDEMVEHYIKGLDEPNPWYDNLFGNLWPRQEWQIYAPTRVGQSLRYAARVAERYRRRDRDLVAMEMWVREEAGQLVAYSVHHQSFLAVSVEQRLPGQAKNAILSVLGADLYMKGVVVVDHDVDIFDDRQVTWALATRCQPDRDITVITHARGSDLDPSAKEDGYSAKWGVDATAKPSLAAYTPRHRVPADVWQRINPKDFLP